MLEATPFRIRTMTEADVPCALELSTAAGWNQSADDWRRLHEYEPRGCFVAEQAGEICGTVTTTAYGERFGWIGMLVVRPECRGRGMGKALLQAAMDYLKSIPTETIRLDATARGRTIYEKRGFKVEYLPERWGGVASATGEAAPRAGPADLDEIIALDALAFGAQRPRVLRRLMADFPEHARIIRGPEGRLLGYAMARKGREAWQAGPCIARSLEVGRSLFRAAIGRLAGQDLFLDIMPDHPMQAEFRGHGFGPLRTLTRMCLGPNRHPGRREMTVIIGAFEKG